MDLYEGSKQSLFPRVIGPVMAPNFSLFPRVIGGPVRGSKHFIVFKGYRRTFMKAPNISLFPRVIGPV